MLHPAGLKMKTQEKPCKTHSYMLGPMVEDESNEVIAQNQIIAQTQALLSTFSANRGCHRPARRCLQRLGTKSSDGRKVCGGRDWENKRVWYHSLKCKLLETNMDQHNLLCWINWDKRMFLPQLYITKPGLPINCCPPTQPVFNSTKRGIQVAMPFRTVALHAMIQILREETMPRFHMYELGGSIYRIMGIAWTSKFQTWIYFFTAIRAYSIAE